MYEKSIYMDHFAVYQILTQYFKSTILQKYVMVF